MFASSTILYQGARFVFSAAAARALAPEDFTAWAIVLALLVYAPSAVFGVTNGMSRELPILIGRGTHAAAERTVGAAWSATIGAVAVILAAAGIVAGAVPALGMSAVAVGLLASGTVVYVTQQFILRSRLRFDAASGQQAVFGVVGVAAAAILVFADDAGLATTAALYGIGLLTAVLVGVALLPPPIPRRPDLPEVRRLARIGFPIMLAGLVFSLFVTLDRWMAITLLGPQRAAPYALASIVAAALLVIPTVVSQQTYPRMAIARGSGASADDLRSMARHQGIVAAALAVPVAAAVSLFAWLGIPALLPDYVDATPVVVVLCLGLVVLGSLTGYGNYLNVVGGQWRYLAAQVSGVGFAIGLTVIGGKLAGLVGIALGMSASHLVYGVILRAAAMRTDITGVESPTGIGQRA